MGILALLIITWLKKDWIELNLLVLIFGVLLTIPTFTDGFVQYFSYYESNNKLRFMSGFLGGLGLYILSKFAGTLINSIVF